MARKRFRCPICGHIVPEDNLPKDFPVEFFILRGLGKGKGFHHERVSANSLLESLKLKILVLYHRFFGFEARLEPFNAEPLVIGHLSEPYSLRGFEVVGEA